MIILLNNKYWKYINTKLIIVVTIIGLVFISSILVITKSSFKQKITEVGPIPTWVKWNKNKYAVTGKTVKITGEKLGASEDTSLGVKRDIYSIPNISSDKEIAVKQFGKTYFEAVIKK